MCDSDDAAVAIKTMQLYSHIDRIWNEMEELGYQRDSPEPIAVSILNKFDCYNYSGSEGAKNAAKLLEVTESCMVLDIGSGLGGPARCISDFSGAKVIGIELQSDLAALANEISARCGIAENVSVIAGDFLDPGLSLDQYIPFDAVVSWLVILHIPVDARYRLFERIHQVLKPGGRVYIEDFFLRDVDLSERERQLLEHEVFVKDAILPTRQQYIDILEATGFVVSFEDVTADWTSFTAERHQSWRDQRDRHLRVQNEETWTSLDRFYSAISELFGQGKLGGVKILLEK